MAIQIPNHSHCVICSRAVAFGDKTCSDKCETQHQELQKRRKRSMILLYGLMALSVLLLLMGSMGSLPF